jgi:hypothetical protein
VKRRSGAAHIPPMNETTGTISLDTLKRSVHWVDRYGNQHALTDMTQDYLQNTLAHLRRMGSALYSLELKRRDREVLLAEMTGWENGADVSVAPRGEAAAAVPGRVEVDGELYPDAFGAGGHACSVLRSAE